MQGLQSNNDRRNQRALSDVQGADTYLNQQLAFYGTVQDRLQGAVTLAKTTPPSCKRNSAECRMPTRPRTSPT